MRAACALGLPSGLLEHFELSFETGIGGFLHEHGRILRRGAPEAQGNDQIEKEFQILGAQVAIPILDREKLIGVAAFDGRVTGEPIGSSELTLVFHLLEELALAVKNIWLHDQLAANHETLADILRQLSTACVVVSRDLKVLHVNKRARQLFPQTGPRTELDFSDLPQALGSKVYQVLRTGTTLAPFKFHPDDARRNVYNVTVIPLQREHAEGPHAAVLLVDDITQTEQLQQLEIEAANLRLVKTMADRLAHEIGNAMVPLSTHQQLLADKYRDPEFRASLDHALADGVKRVTRLINQMRFLARDTILSSEAFPLVPLVEEAYQEALKHQPFKSASLKQNAPSQPVVVSGERPALKHAIAEVILNALQANPAEPKVEVRSKVEADSAGTNWLHIEVQDNGAGFSAAALKMLPEPFYTTRNVGLGLGLTVTRKIVETHRGKLVIGDVQNGKQGVVRISLPLAKEGNTSTGGGRQVPASKAT
jgi:signal transduction histidine kinase